MTKTRKVIDFCRSPKVLARLFRSPSNLVRRGSRRLGDGQYVEELREIYLKRIDELKKRVVDPQALSASPGIADVEGVFADTLHVMTALYGPDSPQIKALMEMHKLSSTRGCGSDWLVSPFAQFLLGVLMNIRKEIQAGLVESVFRRRLAIYLEIWWVFAKIN